MASSRARHPVKVKSLTLLELCQTINDLRHASSRGTTQLLTRRLYLHPVTVNSNTNQQSTKLITNNLFKADQLNQSSLDKMPLSRKKIPSPFLSILSPTLSLPPYPCTKMNVPSNSDKDDNTDYDASTTATSSLSQFTLPTITRHTPLTSKKRSVFTRSIYVPNKRNIHSNQKSRKEQLDIWHHFDYTLERPMPVDPPTTPLSFDVSTDFHLQNIQEPQEQFYYNSIDDMKIYKRNPICDSMIN